MSDALPPSRIATLAAVSVVTLATVDLHAGGFEIPDNTAESLARGGTGAAGKRNPSAVYFNPALLPKTTGFEFQLDTNLVYLQAEFRRDDLGEGGTALEFAPVKNEAGPFPVPFIAASYDFGIDNLGVGFGAYGPHAYGRQCYAELVDGECIPDPESAARFMMVESNLIQFYLSLAAGYRFRDVLGGNLSIGLTASAAYQQNDFTLYVDEVIFALPFDEDPNNGAVFRAQDLSGWQPTGKLGVAWESSGVTIAASYRPPIKWKTNGTAELEFPQQAVDLADPQTTGDDLVFETWQAGSLRGGINYVSGEHPGRKGEPRFDLELNVVWEDWSRTESFEIDTQFDIILFGSQEQELAPISQPKRWQDVFSVRVGASYAPLSWSTVHVGGFAETPAQRAPQTNADFLSWERYAFGFGNTFHLLEWLDLDVAYAFVLSPDRRVTDGDVYQQLPLSGCTGPDYTDDACAEPGVPPGNAQNEGEWSSNSQMFGLGLTATLD